MSTEIRTSGAVAQGSGSVEVGEAEAVAVLEPALEVDLSELFEQAVSLEPAKAKPKERSIEHVNRLFQEDKLLLRAMEDDSFDYIEDLGGPRILGRSYGNEIDLMKGRGLLNASCTLLVPGRPVATYKPYGILLNGRTAEVLHVAIQDSGSGTDRAGKLVAQDDYRVESLEALATILKKTDFHDLPSFMNEVNAHFEIGDLEGLVAVTSSDKNGDAMLNFKMRVLQKLIEKTYGITLPMLKYDWDKGTLTPLSEAKMDIRKDIVYSRSMMGREAIRILAPMFGVKG